ncbi:hypothetical protein RO3G_14565 [Rhizopus delemar RA 99-880]|uniref:Uncharacterized protein n=1 Tax=Rhizopus delemar (strain RA 99-880 / ATCC MYA-4621 / FGSC 9543 / NRRL 43880) TaxID=246409 RepID=I1CN24_RHIO9|nr:hypothetical protein RO3G_14565 [Rhizopus delemar RA 99-880]|eukprot:EIE89854.1 hypothetical protein RO3G_14565 [Rhizopus delemar RA 99-880]
MIYPSWPEVPIVPHRYWTTDDWRKVIFSDESKINVWGSDGVEFYWSLPGSPLQPHHVIPTVKHGGGSVMVWALCRLEFKL